MRRQRYLSKREQQIMEAVYQRERATANEIAAALPGSPANSTVRTLLRILEEKGELTHVEEAGRYIYLPARPRKAAGKSVLASVIDTFFAGSVEEVVATLLSEKNGTLDDAELDRLQALIDEARRRGQ